MQMKQIDIGIELHFRPEEQDAARIIERACKRSIPIIHDTWGLTTPSRCRVFVMTSWLRFVFQSAPWYARIPVAVLFPFWCFHMRKQWKSIGGWTRRYSNCPAIGVKPPRLIAQSDTSIGELIFVKEPDLNKKAEHITCHEMAHALSAPLKLPLWINEGIAMVTVDRFFGHPTVKSDTLGSLNQSSRRQTVATYRHLPKMRKEDIAYHYVRGYWITRFLMDTRPGLLRDMLKKRERHRSIEEKIASSLGISPWAFWDRIDHAVVEHFRQRLETNEQCAAPEIGGHRA